MECIDKQYLDMVGENRSSDGTAFFHQDNFDADKARQFKLCATSAMDSSFSTKAISLEEKENMHEKLKMMSFSVRHSGFNSDAYEEQKQAHIARGEPPAKRPRQSQVKYSLVPLRASHASQQFHPPPRSALPSVVYGVQEPEDQASELQRMLQYENDIQGGSGYSSRLFAMRHGTNYVPVQAKTALPGLIPTSRQTGQPAVQAYAPLGSTHMQPLNASNAAYQRQQVIMRIMQKLVHPSVMGAYRAVCTGQGLGFGRCFVYDLCRTFPQYAQCWGRFCPLFHQGGTANNCVFEHAGHPPKDVLNQQLFSGPCRNLPDMSPSLMRGVIFDKKGVAVVPVNLPTPSER